MTLASNPRAQAADTLAAVRAAVPGHETDVLTMGDARARQVRQVVGEMARMAGCDLADLLPALRAADAGVATAAEEAIEREECEHG